MIGSGKDHRSGRNMSIIAADFWHALGKVVILVNDEDMIKRGGEQYGRQSHA